VRALRWDRGSVRDVNETEHTDRQRTPTEKSATGAAFFRGVAQQPPRGEQAQQRYDGGDRTDGTTHDCDDGVTDRPTAVPPQRRGGDDRATNDREPQPVAPLRRVEVASAVSDRAGGAAEEASKQQPQAGEQPAERTDEPDR
jgi:hypothetical protein